jgi:hypothetical protein
VRVPLILLVASRSKALHTRLELYRESSTENTVHEELVMTMAYLKVCENASQRLPRATNESLTPCG